MGNCMCPAPQPGDAEAEECLAARALMKEQQLPPSGWRAPTEAERIAGIGLVPPDPQAASTGSVGPLVLAPGSMAHYGPEVRDDTAACTELAACLQPDRASFERLPDVPPDGAWLSLHNERGQSFEQYVAPAPGTVGHVPRVPGKEYIYLLPLLRDDEPLPGTDGVGTNGGELPPLAALTPLLEAYYRSPVRLLLCHFARVRRGGHDVRSP